MPNAQSFYLNTRNNPNHFICIFVYVCSTKSHTELPSNSNAQSIAYQDQNISPNTRVQIESTCQDFFC